MSVGPPQTGTGQQQKGAFTFTEFLTKLKHESSATVAKDLKRFSDEFNASPYKEDEESRVLEFMDHMNGKVARSPQWKASTPDEIENAKEGIEKYLMTKIYARAWCPTDQELQRDAALTAKMDMLRELITADHFDIPKAFQKKEAFDMATTELLRVNNYKAPRDKLTCVVNCCKVVNIHLVHFAKQAAADGGTAQSISADDFLPVLIFVVLQAQVPHLHSNVQYITRYRHHSRLVSEAAYHFTNLASVVAFFENCSAADFSIDATLYNEHMAGFHEAAATATDAELCQQAVKAVSLPHRFIDCELKDIRVGDVKLLLQEYKLLARAFDALQQQQDQYAACDAATRS